MLDRVTVIDVLDTGACFDGVRDWINRNGGLIAGDPSKFTDVEWIQKAANRNGSGNGYGNGYGDGNGYGYGSGYGSGNGYGDGYGYGNGDGYGWG